MKKFKNTSLEAVIYCIESYYKKISEIPEVNGIFLVVSKLNIPDTKLNKKASINFELCFTYEGELDYEEILGTPYWADIFDEKKYSFGFTGYSMDEINESLAFLQNGRILYERDKVLTNLIKYSKPVVSDEYVFYNLEDDILEDKFENINLDNNETKILNTLLKENNIKDIFGVYLINYKDVANNEIYEINILSNKDVEDGLYNKLLKVESGDNTYYLVIKFVNKYYYSYDEQREFIDDYAYIRPALDILDATILYDEYDILSTYKEQIKKMYEEKQMCFSDITRYTNTIVRDIPFKLIRK